MATSESTCLNKETLNENVNVMIGRGDDISHDSREPELTNANVNDEEKSETITKSAENFDEGTRSRRLTDKGHEERIRRLKQKRTTALSAVTRKRTDITKLMTDTNNLDVVKTELTQLDILCEQFESTHNLYLEELDSPEDKETAYRHYADKENDIFEYRKQVANWITSCEEQIGNHLDGLSDTSKRSRRSRSSRSSRASSSFQSARLKEKAKVAELMAERSMLQEKIKLQVAEEQLQLDLQIARARAREKVFAEMEEEQKLKLPEQDKSLDSFIALPTPAFDRERKHEPPPPVNTPRGPTGTKSERREIEREPRRPLNPEASEFYYRAFPVEVKKEDVAHPTYREDEMLKEIFKVQQEQIQGMFASQNHIATAITLPQPEVPKFKGDPMDFKTFLMAFDTRIQSKVISSTDRLYFLDQHLVGEAKELISGCLHMEPDEGYLEARRLLEKEYGDPYKVSSAYMRKLTSWPTLKYDDGPALKSLSIFLRKCNSAMKTISHLAVLNHLPNMQSVVQKLPFSLQGKWRENVVKTRLKDGKVAGFRQLVEFVEYAAETANDPVYGKEALNKAKHRTNSLTEENKKFPPSKSKVESFATNLDTVFKSPTSNGTGSFNRNISTRRCPLCTKSHDLDDCNDYKRKSVEERRSFLAEKALCFACYGENHQSKRCTKKRTCKKCKKPHPTLLHIDGFSLPKENGTAGQETTGNDNPLKVNNARVDIPQESKSESNILLQTILPVTVTQKGINKPVKTYAFYDNGSAGCFITEQLKIRLKAACTETKLQLGTMHGRILVDSAIVKDLIVTDVNGQNPVELPRAYTRQEIPAEVEQIPTPETVGRIEHLKDIASEIPAYDPELEVGLLIGSNCPSALVPLSVVPNQGDGPFAIRLKHGWTVSGPLHLTTEPLTNKVTANRITVRELESVKEVITPKSLLNLFELDFNEKSSCNLPEDLGYSQEDRKFMALVSDGIRYSEGHYEIPLPFRHQNVNLPNNREQAFKRLLWQKKKMIQNEKYRSDYVAFIHDMIEKGYAEKVPEESLRTDANNAWYIPHHGVYHPKKPEKIRVVFDCSAKFCGTSLNDQLLQGPDLTNSLVGVLTRFRQEPVAFMGDIEAMFYQVRVPVTQRNFLRFLWWPEGDLNAELVEYRMVVHPFGAVSSPSCSNFALRHTAKENENEIGYAVANTMRRNFYVDDCLRSVKTETDGKNQIACLRQACAKGGFRLTKFISNHRSVIESIPEEERSKEVKLLDLNYDDLPIERALGVQWCVESDTFGFRIIVKDKPLTRRGILSSVSSIYDPLGFAAPFTLTAKKLLQDLCREEKLEWDDELPELYRNRWERWRNELPLLERLNVDRCFKPPDFGEVKSREIHIFSDASATGYGSAAYLRLRNSESRIHCSFLMGKARLAPIKVMTIPRLELTAATVSIRLGEVLKKELDDPPDVVKYHTDSTTVLRYIMNDQKRFQVFVANRVQTIRSLSHPSQWMYVETKSNPADDASRGINARALLEHSRWIRGPEFLWQPEEDWPQQPLSLGEEIIEDPEVKKTVTACATTIAEPASIVTRLIEHFSNWYRLKKAVAVFMRVQAILHERRLKRKNPDSPLSENLYHTPIAVKEIEEAEAAILRFIQNQKFSNEIQVLLQDRKASEGLDQDSALRKKTKMRRTSHIYRLDPFIADGILRVGGRLSNADISEDSKHPVILPRRSHVTTLIIRHAHEQLGHVGRGHVLSRLREKYWIVGATSAVRQVISSCVTCRRTKASTLEQKMADLPQDRLTPAPPFTYVGVDYFGPYFVKEGRKEYKRYGALFTCLVSRAVHIEIAHSLETDSFLNALRRFVARRGPVRELRCDNGTNFVGAKGELRKAMKEMDHDEITEKLRQQQIDWKFNPPAASHMGGVWERQIRTTRRILDTLLREHGNRLDDESLHTLICEVEAIINSRPLTMTSSDAKDPLPLTPNQILTMKTSIVLPPPGKFQRNDVYMRRRWRRVQYLCNLFWTRWKREYLPTLQERPKWNQERRNLQVNDIVLIKDESAPRNEWPMGVVADVEPDTKGLVRSVKLRTRKTELRRPVHKLVLILAADERKDHDEDSKDFEP